MKKRLMRDGIWMMGAVDWNRRLFDSLIPLPEGTSYNAYLVKGSEKVALIDTADPELEYVLMEQLEDVERIDYIISLHTEQDHSGAIPTVLAKYPNARVVCSTKAKELLIDHIHLDESVIDAMPDGSTLSLGDRNFTFIHTPWVHWPETMCAYLHEERILFSCDFFGSHLATSDMYAGENPLIYEGAKRYFAEIMMPFRSIVKSNIKKVEGYAIDIIAPSHGPAYDKPEFIMNAYRDWTSDRVSNFVAIPYISMHGSTEIMVNRLLDALVERGVKVQKYELTVTDVGKLAIDLVDAATIGTPRPLRAAPRGLLRDAPGERAAPEGEVRGHHRLVRMGHQGRGTDLRPDPQPEGRGAGNRDVQGAAARGGFEGARRAGRRHRREARPSDEGRVGGKPRFCPGGRFRRKAPATDLPAEDFAGFFFLVLGIVFFELSVMIRTRCTILYERRFSR